MSLVAAIEGFAIVSEDGMLADSSGVMPPSLMFAADQRFFEAGLNEGVQGGQFLPRRGTRGFAGTGHAVQCRRNDRASEGTSRRLGTTRGGSPSR